MNTPAFAVFDPNPLAKGTGSSFRCVFWFLTQQKGVAMKVLHLLWADEAGFVVSTELVLVATILVIGMTVGLVTVRDQVVQELGDVALAIGNVNQSYQYDGVKGHSSSTAGSSFADRPDFCEIDGVDPPHQPPACIMILEGPPKEGNRDQR